MEIITIHRAKTQLSRLIEKACREEEIIIARGSKPVVRLVAIADNGGRRKPGAWKGRISYSKDAFAPLGSGRNWKIQGATHTPFRFLHSLLNPRPFCTLR